ncbi:hypothetical protein NM688_g182 [Phlebia brevispora]|uniref:Uncharacterized protein n=1 Tax=Phlebia brevispora TaxID=194682 RepID=A0ACC1TF10_9APHY|nr:hypothetical protein NM688_g182 [Phlebia brevispora]
MAPLAVKIKHAGRVHDVELDPDLPPAAFKEAIYQKTGVPPERMKVMIKGGILKDDTDWKKVSPKEGQTFMVIGAAGELPKPPSTPIVDRTFFRAADMDDSELAQVLALPVGLVNLGNTCYMNSTVQAMRAIPELQTALQEAPTGGIAGSLKDLYNNMSKTTEAFTPATFLTNLRRAFPQFAELSRPSGGGMKGLMSGGYAQQDAEECWTQMTNALKEVPGLPDPSGSSSGRSKKFVEQYMMGEMRRELKCDEAPEEKPSVTMEKVLKLSCNITITTNYMHQGILDALDEKIEKMSPSLGRNALYTAHSRLSRLPSYLTVHMVRFAWRQDINKKAKIMRRVKFPTEFDAVDLVTDELKEKLLPVSRKLKGVEKERAERRKVRKRTKIAVKKDTDVEMADATAQGSSAGASNPTPTEPAASEEDKGKEVAGAELEDESVYREKEVKELEALVDPSLKADIGSSVSGLYDLVAIVTHKGAAADAGHYMAFVKKSVFHPVNYGKVEGDTKDAGLDEDDEDWYKFDDNKVSIFPKEKLETLAGGGEDSAAYVLLALRAALLFSTSNAYHERHVFWRILQTVFVFGVCWFLWRLFRPYVLKSPLDNIPGPPSPSFFKGNIPQLFNRHNGWEFHVQLAKYGSVVRFTEMFGKRALYVFDPKALYHIMVKDQYIYERASFQSSINDVLLGPGILSATGTAFIKPPVTDCLITVDAGDRHRFQRKNLNPVFSIVHMRYVTPIFYKTMRKLRDAVMAEIKGTSTEVDMLTWMGRAALELIGQGGLGYSFDPLVVDMKDTYGHALKTLQPAISKSRMWIMLSPYYRWLGPAWFRRFLACLVPDPFFQNLVTLKRTMSRSSQDIYNSKKSALLQGDEAVSQQIAGGKDIMSVLLKNNMEAANGERLSEEEVTAQMSTLVLAAMDTTSNALARTLHLLADNPEIQEKLRQEITNVHNGQDISYDSLVELPYLDAICRETLRHNRYPPVSITTRETCEDVIMPLSRPFLGMDGKLINEVFVPRGTLIVAGNRMSNINEELWGEDANEWKPERWLSPLPEALRSARIPGVYSNLMTFIGGSRACIGFKFAQLEMKVTLSILLESFKFSPSDKPIYWNFANVSFPTTSRDDQKPSLLLRVDALRPPTTANRRVFLSVFWLAGGPAFIAHSLFLFQCSNPRSPPNLQPVRTRIEWRVNKEKSGRTRDNFFLTGVHNKYLMDQVEMHDQALALTQVQLSPSQPLTAMSIGVLPAILLTGGLWLLWRLFSSYVRKTPLDNIPGPPPLSFLHGNIPQLYHRHMAWEYHKEISERYGSVVRFTNLFGKRALYVFDPTALHSILVKDQYMYEKAPYLLSFTKVVLGPGILSATGDRHRFHRKILNPVFSVAHMRDITPIFYETMHKLRAGIESEIKGSVREVDILSWMGRAALELIGQGGLGYSFDPLVADVEDEYGSAIKAIQPAISKIRIWMMLSPYRNWVGPAWFQRLLANFVPDQDFQRLKTVTDVLDKHSREIYTSKKKALLSGDDDMKEQVGRGKDIMSILLRSNLQADECDRLSEAEVIAQMSTMAFAAMDTTSNALARILHLLAHHPDAQEKLRKEILGARNGQDISYDKLVDLPYLDAVCRETLRLYPPLPLSSREAGEDLIMPLSKPIRGVDGSLINELLVPRGTLVVAGLSMCNINKDIWGEDADEWKPERWLSPLPDAVKDAHIPGVYANLMTFLGGGRACIGFKFAQLEMKVVLSILLESFRFSPSDKAVCWNFANVSFPSAGMKDPNPSLPLRVEAI